MDDKFFARFGGGQQAPDAPSPAPAQDAPAPQGADPFMSRFGKAAVQDVAPVAAAAPADSAGKTPLDAIPESPLSLMERAMMGWVRKPEEQEKYLKKHFDEVVATNNGDGVGFAVKKDGKWFQADPAFEWKTSTKGAVAGGAVGSLGGFLGAAAGAGLGGAVIPSVIHNIKDLPGDIAQGIGEYGPRASAAAEGAAVAAPYGAAVAGPIGGLVAGVVGGAAGAATMDAAELGTRAALMNPNDPGARPYKSAKEVQDQLLASALFGAEQTVGNKLLSAGAGHIADKFAQNLQRFSETGPGKVAARGILNMMGVDDRLATARLENPVQNAAFDKMRAADIRKGDPLTPGMLDKAHEANAAELESQVTNIVKKQGTEFAKIASDPEVNKAKFSLGSVFQAAKQELQDKNLIGRVGSAIESQSDLPEGFQSFGVDKASNSGTAQLGPNVKRVMGEGDTSAIKFIIRNANRKDMSQLPYREARALVADAQTLLKQGVSNPNLERLLVQIKDGANNSIASTLENVSEGTGVKYGEIIRNYSNVKALAEDLEKTTSGQKRFTIAKKLMSDNMNDARELTDDLLKHGVDRNTLIKFLQMEGSKRVDSWFTNKGFMSKVPAVGKFIPTPGPKAGVGLSNLVTESSGPMDAMAAKAIPYTAKILNQMKQLPPEQLKSVLMDPRGLAAIQGIVQGSVTNEQKQAQDLLNLAGVQQ
jgi:hypothetical protein